MVRRGRAEPGFRADWARGSVAKCSEAGVGLRPRRPRSSAVTLMEPLEDIPRGNAKMIVWQTSNHICSERWAPIVCNTGVLRAVEEDRPGQLPSRLAAATPTEAPEQIGCPGAKRMFPSVVDHRDLAAGGTALADIATSRGRSRIAPASQARVHRRVHGLWVGCRRHTSPPAE